VSEPLDIPSRLAAIVESSDDAIVSKDINGIIVTWNPAAERMFGYTAAEAIGQSIRIIIPADRQSEEDEVIARIRRGEGVAHFETIRQRKDGTTLPISLSVSPVHDDTGRVVGASKIARDITERRRADAAEATRADLEHRLLTLLAASGSVLVSPQVKDVLPALFRVVSTLVGSDAQAVWRYEAATHTWCIAWSSGLSKEFVDTRVHARPDHGNEPETMQPFVAEDVFGAPTLAERAELYRREGVRSLIALPLSLHGEPTGSLVLYYHQRHDFAGVEVQTAIAVANMASAAITTAELYDAQRRSRLDSEFLADASRTLASSLEFEDTLRRMTQQAVAYFADWCAVDLVGEDGRLGRLALAHVDPDKVELARRFAEKYPENPDSPYSVARVVQTGEGIMMEHVPADVAARGASDEAHRQAILALNLSSFMIVPLSTHGQTFGAITFVAADSGRHYNRADLALAQGLASRAAMAIDNARAYDETRRANRVKDDFIATLSHELRNPLSALLGYAKMLEQNVIPADRMQHTFEVIARNATSLSRIVNDVLDISRITSGKLRLSIQTVDLATVVAHSVEAIQPAADAKGVRLIVEPPADPIYVPVDADRIQQVLWNLLSNGVKFTPAGGRVTVAIVPTPDGEWVDLTVRDTGIGISPDFAPHLFERFTQADSRLGREHGGLGLGLAIARHLVELHSGSIRAESAGANRGAMFVVRLLRRQGAITRPPATADLPDEGRPLDRRRSPRAMRPLRDTRVLVVDDDVDALEMIRRVLESAGARVTVATSGERALALFDEARPAVIISDIGMPGMDGLQFIGRVRRLGSAAAALPAAALTAFTQEDDRQRAISAGFKTHISKPVDPDELIAIVQSLTRTTAHG
jgi:PAS domain S-box-containing protein